MKMRKAVVEEQIQQILLYVQGGLADVWKENILEDLEAREIEYESAEEFLAEIKKEFEEEDKELIKVIELKRIEQESRTMEEFVQDFKRVVRGSGYKGCPLIKEFKRGINGTIKRKLIETENQPGSIEQWCKRAITLDKNWRKSRRKEERLKGKKEQDRLVLRDQESRPQIWPRRQSILIAVVPAPIEGVERTNVVVIRN